MNQIFHISTILCTGLFLWMACTETDNNKNTPLSDALRVVDSRPQEALAILERISNPELQYEFDREGYMQYIVIRTQARHMDYQDITGDSLILEAQRYFSQREDYEMAARAGYYAAAYWQKKQDERKMMECLLPAFQSAKQANLRLFIAKSTYWLGTSYFNQEQWDIAEDYCQKAWKLYNDSKEPNTERYQFNILEMLGQIHREYKNPEQAWQYFDEGLKAAQKQNDIRFESRFLRNKGVLHWEKMEYCQAKEHFAWALSKQPPVEDRLRIYLSYAKLYKSMNRPDSTIYFLSRIEERIPEITYPITRRDIYRELSDYYELIEGDANETAHYLSLAHNEELQINKSLNDKDLQGKDEQIGELKQNEQDAKLNFHRSFSNAVCMICLLAFVLIVLGMGVYWWRKKYRELREQQISRAFEQHRLLMAGLRSVAKGIDDLSKRNLAHEGSPVWEQLQTLREEFSHQIAQCTKEMLREIRNGKEACRKFSKENLCVIFLSYFALSDESIGWMLGHRDNTCWYVNRQKEEIRSILTESKVKGIKRFQ